MARKSESERLQDLEKQKTAIQDRIDVLKHKASRKQRKIDTRRKIIGGSVSETHALKNPGSEWSNTYVRILKRSVPPKDRHLFADIFRALLPAAEAAALLADTSPAPDDATTLTEPAQTDKAA